MPRLTAQGWRRIARPDRPTGDRWLASTLVPAGGPIKGLMMRRLALMAFALAVSSSLWGADIDEATLANFGPSGLLRWENVRAAPYWVSGAPLEFDAVHQLHVARLHPGQDVRVHIPSGSLLRVAPVRGPIRPEDVQLWVSNGSGLYRAALSAINADGSLLLASGDLETSLVRIARPACTTCCVEVALFYSRRMVPDEAFAYPCEWESCGPAVSVCTDGTVVNDYQYLAAGQFARLQVPSPGRLRIESRLEYPAFESEGGQTYQLKICDGQRSVGLLQIHTRHERRRVVTINGVIRLVGEREVDYVDLPAAVDKLEIQATASTYLRITAAPCRSAQAAGWLGDGNQFLAESIWNLSPDQAFEELTALDYPVSRRWRVAQRVGRDNRYRDGGIQAWNLLRQLVSQYPAYPELSRRADKAKLAYTVLQPLWPVETVWAGRVRGCVVCHSQPAGARGHAVRSAGLDFVDRRRPRLAARRAVPSSTGGRPN